MLRKWPAWTRHIIPQGAIYSPETRRAYGSALVGGYRSKPSQVWWTSMAVWTAAITTIATLFHPDTVEGCQTQLIVMGLAIVATGVVIAVFKPLRTTSANWFACCSRVCAGLVFFCAAASLDEVGQAVIEAASTGLYAIALVLIVLTALRIPLTLFSTYAEGQIAAENLALALTWAHTMHERGAVTQQFNVEDRMAELEEVACIRSGPDDAADELPAVLSIESFHSTSGTRSSSSHSFSDSRSPTPDPGGQSSITVTDEETLNSTSPSADIESGTVRLSASGSDGLFSRSDTSQSHQSSSSS